MENPIKMNDILGKPHIVNENVNDIVNDIVHDIVSDIINYMAYDIGNDVQCSSMTLWMMVNDGSCDATLV